ncbi:TetR/AcrR family transcriptional regulator [Mycolicibacterium sp. 120266]|uniref:TetR/AcrR family transcriptional regulator n=1 Tax=Mycolicibacterium sp. 120266 TaxID=3090601 RepID=UPI00299DC610|nr:TetR/AcrR family transcriptional regulator [Mycolicibacterium sp. 120266]MDX1873246.1 TetR/AcrR family transcriptional regulator [Mycolicibacterium sp. 120266]
MGRPKEFDPGVAIDQAMHVFWGRGYGATTPQDLADRLKIGKGSLYHAFGGKRQLFDRALRRYLDMGVETVSALLAEPGPAKDILRRVLQFMVETDLALPERRGCFATNSAVEFGRVDPLVTDQLLDLFTRTESAFHALIERGQREGDIRPDVAAAAIASMLLSTVTGFHVLARVEPGPERLLRAVEATIAVL